MIDVRKINIFFTLSCLIGAFVSLYAYIVEVAAETDHDYIPLCDISEHISCTKAFTSDYGKGFGIVGKLVGKDSILNQPNSLGGIFFYLILAGLGLSDSASAVRIQIFLSTISNIMSIYLAYILYFVLYDLCVVCVTTYVINALNLFLSLLKQKRLNYKYQKIHSQFNSHIKQG